jgi:hypothetical protein
MLQIPISRERLEEKRAELAANGITLTGDIGVIDSHGVRAVYSYDGTTLSVEVKGKPFLVSKSYVEGKIKEWLS